jgi:hypothetical protein
MAAVWECLLMKRLASRQLQTPESGEQQEGLEKLTATSRFLGIQRACCVV